MASFRLTRRQLLVSATGATAVAGGAGLWLGYQRVADRRYRRPVERAGSFAPSVFVAVETSGDVVIWLTRSEMGQGAATALPMLIAEELDADWSRVRIEQAVAGDGHDYGSLFTAASSGITSNWIELRRAGAAARAMLVAAAARRWGVSARQCETESGTVRHVTSGLVLGYGELADSAAREWPPLRPALKHPADFRLIGKPLPRLDAVAKVTGKAVYGLDVRRQGMLRAVIARSPRWHDKLESYNDEQARAVPGVRHVIKVRNGIAVVADNTYAAMRGRDALQIHWASGGDEISDAEVTRRLRATLDAESGGVARDDGEALARLANGATLTAEYELPYLAHAPMEPMNCVAHVAAGRCEIWAPTQTPDGARETAAAVAGLPLDRVVVHTTYLGGGFGRRAASDFVAEAVEVSAAIQAPVQVVWTREDDLRHGEYREASAHRVRVRLDSDGLPEAWHHRVVTANPGAFPPGEVMFSGVMGASDLPYTIPHQRVEWAGAQVPVPTRIWRSVGYSWNTFAVESVLDELAHHAGQDPVAYRLALLAGQPRLAACVRRAAEMAGWGDSVAGRAGLGIAACQCFGSFVALVVEIAEPVATDFRNLSIRRVWCAADCGIAVNPDAVIAQLEGGILFGMSAALYGKITLRDGQIVEGNFDRYRLMRIAEAPDIEVALLPSAEPPGGIGEVGVPPIAPALANAVFDATGRRVRRLPFMNFVD